ncbi:MAG: hypothetical protein N0A24_07575 [Armatimonadetes bacterium]|nr:hypothetical protein [Armatimonadota bacterium]MDW8154060.1 hypothetical protein [Armatimonadota bacterium]
MLVELGPQKVIDTPRRMGIRSPLQPNLSLALGTSEVTPLEMAAAFATLAAGGVYAEPVAITRVLDVLPGARGRRASARVREVRAGRDVRAAGLEGGAAGCGALSGSGTARRQPP